MLLILNDPALSRDLPDPNWGDNGHTTNGKALTLSNHATELMAAGDYVNAGKYYNAAVEADPGAYLIVYNRAMYFRETHQWERALRDLNTSLRLKPVFTEAYLMRGAINDRLGNYRDALADYNGLVKIFRRDSGLLDCRASLLATCPDASVRNGKAAVSDATAACKISNWGAPQFIDTLAAAYAETGDFESAVRFEQKAIAQARKVRSYSEGMERRLTLYQQRKPYREKPGTLPRSVAKSGTPKQGE
jgi:tetratricopeptide (TPR) repeat protein